MNRDARVAAMKQKSPKSTQELIDSELMVLTPAVLASQRAERGRDASNTADFEEYEDKRIVITRYTHKKDVWDIDIILKGPGRTDFHEVLAVSKSLVHGYELERVPAALDHLRRLAPLEALAWNQNRPEA